MHFKQNNKESKRYLQGLRPFKNSIPKNLKKIITQKGYIYSEILEKWKNLVGEEISKNSFPKKVKISSQTNHGILTLAVKRGDEIHIEYSKKYILDQINSYFGYSLINELRLETFGALNEKKLGKNELFLETNSSKFEDKIKKINNKNIRDALYNLFNIIKK